MGKVTLTAGALLRREIRRALDKNGIAYIEDKGWLDSQFVITADNATIRRIRGWVKQFEEEDA